MKQELSPTGQLQPIQPAGDYDLEGLQNDFPTATELERFVYDQTQVVLNLKGRSNKVKYATALAVLNGLEVDPRYIGGDNPYIERADLIPEEPLKPVPARDPRLPAPDTIATNFFNSQIPHPDPSKAAEDKKVHVQFRKYRNGMISYEVLGPIEPRPEGMKLDKYGRERPEIIRWVDPRTGEQLLKDRDGSYSEVGNRLRGLLQKKFKIWHWIDRDVLVADGGNLTNVWGIEE